MHTVHTINTIIAAMMPASSHSHRQQIRRQLRREEIESYFDSRRRELSEVRGMGGARELNGRGERAAFLREMREALRGEQWAWALGELRRSLGSFAGCLQEWVEEGVIDWLCDSLKSKAGLCDLQWRVCELLGDVLGQETKKELAMVVELMNRGIIENAVCLLRGKYFAGEQRGAFFYLLGTLCKTSHRIRQFAVKMGVDDLLHEYGQDLLSSTPEQYLLYNFTGYCQLFLTIIRTQQHVYLPDIHSTVKIIPDIVLVLRTRASVRIQIIALRCLRGALQMKKDAVVGRMMCCGDLVGLLMRVVGEGEWELRSDALSVLNMLADNFETEAPIVDIWQRGLADILVANYCSPMASVFMRQLTLNVTLNLTISEGTANAVIGHRLFEVVVGALGHANEVVMGEIQKIRLEGFCCLLVVLETVPERVNELVKKYRLAEVLLEGAQGRTRNVKIQLTCLQLLQLYIRCGSSSSFNATVDVLERVYSLSSTLEQLLQHRNADISGKAGVLIDYISQCVSASQ